MNDPPDLAAAFDDSRPIVLTGYMRVWLQQLIAAADWGITATV
ncbi:MAG: hypothetical protein R1F54_06035 [Candidatus Zeuxoniibacter abyssi]|nr:MAG: hypothetical protein R1F54_06035 [Candidatus Persebacteraceae bacterium AB1(2)]